MKSLISYAGLIAILFFISAEISSSQTIATDPDPVVQLTPGEINLPADACGDIVITQSASQTIAGNSVACINTGTGFVRENSFYRAFDLSSFGLKNDFEICQVQVGIQRAEAGSGGEQPATLNLYTSSEPFPGGFPDSLNLIGTTGVIQIADQAMTILTIPITGTAPLGPELVVELFIPDGLANGNDFFIGTNAAGETGPSYVRGPECGIPSPVTLASLNFPNVHTVMNVVGDELPPLRNVPTVSELGLIVMAGILGIIGCIAIRRRSTAA